MKEASGSTRSSRSKESRTIPEMANIQSGTLFPFFDHISQNVDLPGIVCAILFVWFTLQNLLTNLWIPGNPLILSYDPLTQLSRFLFYIGSFSDLEVTTTNQLIIFIVNTVVFVLTVAIIGILLFRYARSRTYITVLLIPARILLEILPLTMVFPAASSSAHAIIRLLDGEGGIYFLFFIFGLLEFIGYLAIFSVSITLLGSSPFLPEGPFCFFSPIAHRNHVLGVSICFFCSIISSRFDSWFMFIVVFAHIFQTLFNLWQFSFRPFIDNWCNAFHIGFCIYMILMDIATVVIRFWDPSQGMIYFILIFLLAVVAGVLAWFYWKFSTKRMHAILEAVNADQTVSEEDLFRLFDDLKLNRSASHALFILDCAVSANNMRIFDFTYMKYITAAFRETEVLTHCARLISWLPYCARPLNYLCTTTVARRDLGLADKFILFQLERIRLCRESSSSHTATEKLLSAKTVSAEMAQIMRSFWERNECSLAFLNVIAGRLSSANSLWAEIIENFPNSLQFRDLYITYLIETTTHYADSVFQKSRAEMIETGVSFRIDNCFRRFVVRHPAYLKRKIMDTKGNAVKGGVSKGSASGGSSGDNHGDGENLDAALEEVIGRSLFSQSRVRLTMERAFQGRAPRLFPLVIGSAIIQVIVSLIVFLYLQIYFQTYFDERTDVADRVYFADRLTHNYYLSTVCWIYYWGMEMDIIDYAAVITPILETESLAGAVIPQNITAWDERAIYFNHQSREFFRQLLLSVEVMAQEGLSMKSYAGSFFDSDAAPLYICSSDGMPLFSHQGDFRTIFLYMLLLQSAFRTVNTSLWFSQGRPHCITFKTLALSPTTFDGLRSVLTSRTEVLYQDAVSLLGPMKWWAPLALCAFCVIMWLPATILYVREVNHFTTMLLSLPKVVKRECMKPIRRDIPIEDGHESQGILTSPGYSLPIVFNAVILGFIGVTCVINILQAKNIEDVNFNYGSINTWILNARNRKCRVLEAFLGMLTGVLLHTDATNNTANESLWYISKSDADSLVTFALGHLTEQNKQLFEDTDTTSSIIGWNEVIDTLSLQPSCETESTVTFHDSYRCGSAQFLMEFFQNVINAYKLDWGQSNGLIGNSEAGHMIHLLNRHLLPMLLAIDDAFGDLVEEFRSSFIGSHQLYTVGAILVQAFVVVLIVWYHRTMVGCYNVLLALLRRVPPAHIIASEPLENYLLSTSSGKKRVGMSADERIIDTTADCIILCGPSRVIDMINPAVTECFGYSPEQLLGQPLVSLIAGDDEEGGSKLEQQMKLMADRQSAAAYEGHVTCVADDDTEVPCLINLLALFHGDDVSAFVAILRNETQLLLQQQEAEIAKSQSEALLYQMLPRDIVLRLNAGEKDISFSIPSATIMFIDIQKFSEYAANLAPQQIMGNLSLIFAAFDQACAKYELLLKIKLIGDIYMCAGGLFTPDVAPSAHAEQMVRCAFDALLIIEEINVKLTSFLAVRIGINTGGPILAGVLGTDRPAFDIIGDSINVAARLQSTDIAGKVQISAATHELLSGLEFQMDYRGEIDLKGKGMMKTFFIDPPAQQQITVSVSQSTLEDITRLMPQ